VVRRGRRKLRVARLEPPPAHNGLRYRTTVLEGHFENEWLYAVPSLWPRARGEDVCNNHSPSVKDRTVSLARLAGSPHSQGRSQEDVACNRFIWVLMSPKPSWTARCACRMASTNTRYLKINRAVLPH